MLVLSRKAKQRIVIGEIIALNSPGLLRMHTSGNHIANVRSCPESGTRCM